MDRTSTTRAGLFDVSVDRDHLGRYRGHQAMKRDEYRGWHYHVTSEHYSQMEITAILEEWLYMIGAGVVVPPRIAIGNVEYQPALISCWQLGKRQTVLWISGYNHTLHIESNKTDCYAVGIVTKPDLVAFLKKRSGTININLREKKMEHENPRNH